MLSFWIWAFGIAVIYLLKKRSWEEFLGSLTKLTSDVLRLRHDWDNHTGRWKQNWYINQDWLGCIVIINKLQCRRATRFYFSPVARKEITAWKILDLCPQGGEAWLSTLDCTQRFPPKGYSEEKEGKGTLEWEIWQVWPQPGGQGQHPPWGAMSTAHTPDMMRWKWHVIPPKDITSV